MNFFCTIVDSRHLPYAITLAKSLQRVGAACELYVLVTDPTESPVVTGPGLHVVRFPEILDTPEAAAIYRKYAATNPDEFRWALKPVFILYLLQKGFEKVIYTDADLYFLGNPEFLFRELDDHALLLSPHWSTVNPLEHEDGLYSVLRNGLYSGCLVGASTKGMPVIRWWAGVCHFKMEKVKELGLYDDQKYLDLFPLLEAGTAIIRHKGCNITSINIRRFSREWKSGKLVIDTDYEAIFIHFTRDTLLNIQNGNDPALKPVLDDYIQLLKESGLSTASFYQRPESLFGKIKSRTRIRTRFKRFLFNLAEKL